MDGFILASILKHLDGLGLYEEERKQGITPFLLMDGHQSRFELEFLRYINDEKTKWNTCIGVPYGTALWQVGDSSQQNGKFKILLTKKKRELFEKRLKSFCQHVHLLRSDIMILIRDTWMEAFGNIESNLKAIGDRGWNPLNKMLLIHPIILATITKSRIKFELERKIFPSKVLESLAMAAYIESNGNVSFSVMSNESNNNFNFKGGPIATHVANSIMAEMDRKEACERNKSLKSEGRSVAERVALITKKMTAGKLVLDGGSFHLDENVLQQAERRHLKVLEKEMEVILRDELKYFIDCHKADIAIAKNSTADVRKWKSASDIVSFLRPLRMKEDTAMPTKRADLETRYYQWSARNRAQIVHQRETYEAFRSWKTNQNSKKKAKPSKRGN